jgi:hypothetical protein
VRIVWYEPSGPLAGKLRTPLRVDDRRLEGYTTIREDAFNYNVMRVDWETFDEVTSGKTRKEIMDTLIVAAEHKLHEWGCRV